VPAAEIDRDIEALLARVERDLGDEPSADGLRQIRSLFDDATFLTQLKDLLARRHNDPQIYEIPNTIMRIMRRAEELRDERETDRGVVNSMALGGGTGLIVGGIVACLNPVIGLFAIIPAIGGLAMAGTSWMGVRRLDKERTLYRQIAERLAVIYKAIG
jgi:hypothetical protein